MYRCARCGALAKGEPEEVNGWPMDAVCAADARRAIERESARKEQTGGE